MTFKVIMIGMLLCVALSYFQLLHLGMTSRETGRDPHYVSAHRTFARLTLLFMTLFVVAVEVGVRMKGGATHDALFLLHIFGASIFFVMLIVLNLPWFNGLHSTWHGTIGKVSVVPFLVMVVTGVPMLFMRF